MITQQHLDKFWNPVTRERYEYVAELTLSREDLERLATEVLERRQGLAMTLPRETLVKAYPEKP